MEWDARARISDTLEASLSITSWAWHDPSSKTFPDARPFVWWNIRISGSGWEGEYWKGTEGQGLIAFSDSVKSLKKFHFHIFLIMKIEWLYDIIGVNQWIWFDLFLYRPSNIGSTHVTTRQGAITFYCSIKALAFACWRVIPFPLYTNIVLRSRRTAECLDPESIHICDVSQVE